MKITIRPELKDMYKRFYLLTAEEYDIVNENAGNYLIKVPNTQNQVFWIDKKHVIIKEEKKG
jgi:hypothetical protein